jgi:branched-subunit amino acid transport protein
MNDYLVNPMLSSPLNLWLTIILAGLITYAIRLSFILIFSRFEIPIFLRRALNFVPPAVLTAIIFPELLVRDGQVNVSVENARLIAGILAVVVAWRTKNALLTIVVGMAALWIIQWLM